MNLQGLQGTDVFPRVFFQNRALPDYLSLCMACGPENICPSLLQTTMGVTPPRSKRVVYTQGTKRRNFLFVVFAITFSTCAFISLSMGFGSEFRRHLGLSDWMQGPAHALFMVRRAAANASQPGEGVGGPERKEPSIKLKGTKKTPPPVVVTLPTADELAEQEASRTISLVSPLFFPLPVLGVDFSLRNPPLPMLHYPPHTHTPPQD